MTHVSLERRVVRTRQDTWFLAVPHNGKDSDNENGNEQDNENDGPYNLL